MIQGNVVAISDADAHLRWLRAPILSLSLALAFCCVANAGEITSLIGAISDGDTLTLLDESRTQHKIRLAFIDAPEKKQPCGPRSKQHLSDLAFGKEGKADCYKVDRYGRQVCTVYVDGKDVGLAQLDV